ncbi:MAG: phage shock protein PspA [Candidatus Dormibacteria bacterium]
MARTLQRWFNYFGTKMGMSLEARADPQVQLQQAVDEMQRRHSQLIDQAAAVIGNLRELDIKIGEAEKKDAQMTASTREALRLSQSARAAGKTAEADRYEQTARAFAAQLASIESQLNDYRDLHEKAQAASDNAKRMVDQNAFQLREAMAKREELETQLQSAKMQERMNASMQSATGLAAQAAVPTFEEVQKKIGGRYAKALGKAEILGGGVDQQMLEVQQRVLASSGDAKLEEIRRSLEGPAGGPGTGQHTLGAAAGDTVVDTTVVEDSKAPRDSA